MRQHLEFKLTALLLGENWDQQLQTQSSDNFHQLRRRINEGVSFTLS